MNFEAGWSDVIAIGTIFTIHPAARLVVNYLCNMLT